MAQELQTYYNEKNIIQAKQNGELTLSDSLLEWT